MKAGQPVQIPEIRLIAAAETSEAKAVVGFRWAASTVGNRHKLGGVPDWLQVAEMPACVACTQRMSFYGQLDSIGESLCLADCGIIYVFVCFDCFTTQSILQSG
jgi:hypothetical protein